MGNCAFHIFFLSIMPLTCLSMCHRFVLGDSILSYFSCASIVILSVSLIKSMSSHSFFPVRRRGKGKESKRTVMITCVYTAVKILTDFMLVLLAHFIIYLSILEENSTGSLSSIGIFYIKYFCFNSSENL